MKFLISAESRLRGCMLDALHEAGIEIVSPTFMNQRQLSADRLFIPKRHRTAQSTERVIEESRPEERMFDKAELAEFEAKLVQELKNTVEELDRLQKDDTGAPAADTSTALINKLKARREEIEAELEQRRTKKQESNDEGR